MIYLPVKLAAPVGANCNSKDTIAAFRIVNSRLPKWELDIIGNGPALENLRLQANNLGNISFLEPLDYGEAFFRKLRTYDVVIIPARGLEEAKIAFAAASGCVIVFSNTPTLRTAFSDVRTKWEFYSGNPESPASALISVCQCMFSF